MNLFVALEDESGSSYPSFHIHLAGIRNMSISMLDDQITDLPKYSGPYFYDENSGEAGNPCEHL